MMTVIETACAAFRHTVSEAKTEIMCLKTKDGRHIVTADGHVYVEWSSCVLRWSYQRRQRSQCRDYAVTPDGMVVLPAVQDRNL